MISVCHTYDNSCGINPVSSAHSTANLEKDLKVVVHKLLLTSKVFEHIPDRSHASLTVKGSIFSTINKQKLLSWMKDRYSVIA